MSAYSAWHCLLQQNCIYIIYSYNFDLAGSYFFQCCHIIKSLYITSSAFQMLLPLNVIESVPCVCVPIRGIFVVAVVVIGIFVGQTEVK